MQARHLQARHLQARHLQLALLFCSRLVQTMMRMAIGPLLTYLCQDLTCDATTKGSLLSAFSLGYITTQVAGGALADHIGPRNTILLATVLAGCFTLASGSAQSVSQLWLLQVVMGAAQGPLFPTSIAYLGRWMPADERALASSLLDAGITVGSLVALPFSGQLAVGLGWRVTLRAWGGLTLLFAVLWRALSLESPAQCTWMSREEREHLKATVPAQKPPTPTPAKGDATQSSASSAEGRVSKLSLLATPPLWAIFASHAAFNFGVYFITSWTPTYYEEELGLRPDEATLALMMPPLVNLGVKLLLCKPLETAMRDVLRLDVLRRRRAFSCLGFIGAAAALMLVPQAAAGGGSPHVTACFCVALGFGERFLPPRAAPGHLLRIIALRRRRPSLTRPLRPRPSPPPPLPSVALHPSGFKANYLDAVSPTHSGFVSGVGNTIASAASFGGPIVVGHILKEYRSWQLVFAVVAAANLCAAIVFGTLSTATPVDTLPAQRTALPAGSGSKKQD
jgi:sugar phosphate permease